MNEVERIEGLADAVVARVVTRLQELEPSAVAIVVTGSYARGRARPDSDLDATAITRRRPVVEYRTWFEPREPGEPLHVSAGACSVKEWTTSGDEPASWALGFPAVDTASYLWAEPEIRERIGDPPSISHPAGTMEVEDFVEATAKSKHAASVGDWVGARWHAHDAGLYVPALLLPWNQRRVVTDRRDALGAALALDVAPPGYHEDLSVVLGVVAADDRDVADAVLRLARGMLSFLREQAHEVDAQPYTAECLADGSFERHLGL